MTTRETQIAAELKANARRLREKAQTVEKRWRTAHGFDTKLRSKDQRRAKAKQEPFERGEVRRREERSQQRIEREVLRVPLLKGVGSEGPSSDAGSRLIKRLELT